MKGLIVGMNIFHVRSDSIVGTTFLTSTEEIKFFWMTEKTRSCPKPNKKHTTPLAA
jgi:hypothetical protein